MMPKSLDNEDDNDEEIMGVTLQIPELPIEEKAIGLYVLEIYNHCFHSLEAQHKKIQTKIALLQ